MKVTTLQAAFGLAALLLSAQPADATHSHHLAHSQYGKKHAHLHRHQDLIEGPEALKKRGVCSLPDHPDLVKVPGQMNNGFAMSPDQVCADGGYCPIACVPGKVMAQWKPNTTYKYPESMDGGLYCDGGQPVKPFPDKPYCVDGTGTISAQNQCSQVVSFCQTVLPGNEAMLIPTDVQPGQTSVLAVPGPSYWASTAAHYYINPPGTPGSKGCIWGDPSQPIGNWAAYVAGSNTDENGQTFVKIGWNPIYTDCALSKIKPTYGVSIECPQGGCNGTPCRIDPSTMDVNGVESPVSAEGVGGANFCVVTVPKGKSANIVVFSTDGSKASAPSSSSPSKSAAAPPSSSTSSKPAPPTSSSAASSSSAPASSSLSSSWSAPFSSSSSSSSSAYPTVLPGIFHENSTYSTGVVGGNAPAATTAPKSSSTGAATEPVPSTSKNEGAAEQGGAAIAGLIVAIVAAAALY
ncbi:hypothetical protein BR93DRAFT_874198 [Coniochaeta sp. PMI_546]|nr:hypothetical protein BR93DRAFT_874198 [Coniochaeta sp. PMI_546]